MAEYASKGGAYGVGIPALALGGLAFLQNGNLGNILGGGGCGSNHAAAQAMYANQIASKDAEIGQLKAEKYTDQAQLDTRDRIAALNKDVIGYVVELGQKAAVAEERNICLAGKVSELQTFATDTSKELAAMLVREAETQKDIQCLGKTTADRFAAMREETRQAIALESERRTNGDQNLMCYVNATFVPGKLVMPKSNICPEPMDAKNAWVNPSCGCGCASQNG